MASNLLHKGSSPNLLARLREMLEDSARADIAVGYFFINGFGAIQDALSGVDAVRILVGRTDGDVLESVAAGLQQSEALQQRLESDAMLRRSERGNLARAAAARIAEGVSQLPQSPESEDAVSALRRLVASGQVQVRAYRRSPLHAKAYLCWYEGAEPGAAVVGSSNLTLAGFEGNTELNVRITGDAEMSELGEWFEGLWADSEDISEELVEQLKHSWVEEAPKPYLVYLKMLKELYWQEPGRLAREAEDRELANFQLDAVARGLQMIEQHGGCYIGDVVGLGKTFVGSELLRQLKYSDPSHRRPMILCPAGLIPMWRAFSKRFNLDAEVISHNMVVPSQTVEYDEEIEGYVNAPGPEYGTVLLDEWGHLGAVLIDEAHNFRNDNQRRRGLVEYLEAGEHELVLMSATPQNLGPMDIYRQLSLFMHDTDHGMDDLEPQNLQDYFKAAAKWTTYRANEAAYPRRLEQWKARGSDEDAPSVPQEPSEPYVHVPDMLGRVFLRRLRKHIRDEYGETAQVGGRAVSFPEAKLTNVPYNLDRVYAKAGSFRELEDALKRHEASRYRPLKYLREDRLKLSQYSDLGRSNDRVAGLMQALLLKRLESSVKAFESTVESLMRSNRNFREALVAGYVPVGKVASRMLSGQEFDAQELLGILEQEESRDGGKGKGNAYPIEDFRGEEWLADLDSDFAVLEELLARISGIEPEDDDKLSALREFLEKVAGDGKVLIFSEAERTIDYLYEQLNPGGADSTIARLSGSNSGQARDIVTRFSPGSNLAPDAPRPTDEVRVLLATDVVSEGQNLQDCARVLNYDLHWNPVRLIQRFGRVDRIGTEHTEIYLHSMWPDLDVDASLDLTARLNGRIQAFHDLIGLDGQLLSDRERLNREEMFKIYKDLELPEVDDGLDEVSVQQQAVTRLQRIEAEDPELWEAVESLADGVRSALAVVSVERHPDAGEQMSILSQTRFARRDPVAGETLVLLEQGGVKGCYAVGDDLEPRRISSAQLARAAECERYTPREDLPERTNERVMAAFDAFKETQAQRVGRARRRRQTKGWRFVRKQLNLLRDEAEADSSEWRRIDGLLRIYREDQRAAVEDQLKEMQTQDVTGQNLLRRLEALRDRYLLSAPEPDEDPTPPEVQVIRIVCSDGLVGGG